MEGINSLNKIYIVRTFMLTCINSMYLTITSNFEILGCFCHLGV